MLIFRELFFPSGACVAFVTMIFPWTTYRFPTRELQYVMCGGLWVSVIYSVSLLEYGLLSAGRHWIIYREYGGISRRNAMDSTRDSSVVEQCAPKFFNWVEGFISDHLRAVKLFPVKPRVITGPPKMSLLLEVKITPVLIIISRLILVAQTDDVTERIRCILCMHLAACRFFTHLTALMHLQSSFPNASSCILFFLHTRLRRDITENYYKKSIIAHTLQTQSRNFKSIFILGYIDYCCVFKISENNIGIQAHAIYTYVKQQPVTGIPI